MITVDELQAILGDAQARGHGAKGVAICINKDASMDPKDLAYGLYTDSEGDTLVAIDGMRGMFADAEDQRNVAFDPM